MNIHHPFYGKKVVFKFPHPNLSCFTFYAAYELINLLRLATDEEIKLGKRLDNSISKINNLSLDKDFEIFLNNNIKMKNKIKKCIEDIERKEKELNYYKIKLNLTLITLMRYYKKY